MRGLTFAVAALAAAQVSAEDTNEAIDNSYFMTAPGYPAYMDHSYGYNQEPRFMEQPHRYAEEPRYMGQPAMRYAVEEPRYAPEPHFAEYPRYPEPRYEESRARYIEMPRYAPEFEPEMRFMQESMHAPRPVHE